MKRMGKRLLEDLDRDIREHIELATQENIDRGMAPEEARYAAQRKFGNVTRVKEEVRQVWSFIWLEQLLATQELYRLAGGCEPGQTLRAASSSVKAVRAAALDRGDPADTGPGARRASPPGILGVYSRRWSFAGPVRRSQ